MGQRWSHIILGNWNEGAAYPRIIETRVLKIGGANFLETWSRMIKWHFHYHTLFSLADNKSAQEGRLGFSVIVVKL